MKELLNVNMESSEITEEWVRKHYNVQKERKTTTRDVSASIGLSDYNTEIDGRHSYDKFFDLLKDVVDAHILRTIVNTGIRCNEKDIKIELELDTDYWFESTTTYIYVYITYKHTETVKEAIKRLITTNKRALTALKRKTKKKNALVEKINKMPDTERKELLAELSA